MKAHVHASPQRAWRLGERGISWSLGSAAAFGVVILCLLGLFLLREAGAFFPQSRASLQAARSSGLEAVRLVAGAESAWHEVLANLHAVRATAYNVGAEAGQSHADLTTALAVFDTFLREAALTVEPLREATRPQAWAADDMGAPALGAVVNGLATGLDAWENNFAQVWALRPREMGTLGTPDWGAVESARAQWGVSLARARGDLAAWDPTKAVGWGETVGHFLAGPRWMPGGEGEARYGLLPLLLGSLTVGAVALGVAVPLALGGAVYAVHYARPFERRFLRPTMEIITVIPAVVLGFLGVAVLGDFLRAASGTTLLAWFPGFPLLERLNPLTAGILLAVMATPTIFVVAEQALRRVEARMQTGAYALGANRWQCLWDIVLPQAMPGLVAGLLLGFSRVLGESMIVLLCSGNRLALPGSGGDPNGLFAPVHTMTGIIAQEMGEVSAGSLHYHALFMLGLVLFTFSLLLNFGVQRVLFRLRLSYA